MPLFFAVFPTPAPLGVSIHPPEIESDTLMSSDTNSQPKTKPKIVFLGNDFNLISLACLKAILAEDRYQVLVGVDCPEKSFVQRLSEAAGRYGWPEVAIRLPGMIFQKIKTKVIPTVANWQDARTLFEMAQLSGTEFFECVRVNGKAVHDRLKIFEPDLVVSANFSQIIRPRFLTLSRWGAINFHPSLLPKYRGPTPWYWVLKNGESVSGVTIHFIDDGIDTGEIIAQTEIPILPRDSEASLITRSLSVGPALVVSAIESVLDGTASPIPQDETAASYYGFPKHQK